MSGRAEHPDSCFLPTLLPRDLFVIVLAAATPTGTLSRNPRMTAYVPKIKIRRGVGTAGEFSRTRHTCISNAQLKKPTVPAPQKPPFRALPPRRRVLTFPTSDSRGRVRRSWAGRGDAVSAPLSLASFARSRVCLRLDTVPFHWCIMFCCANTSLFIYTALDGHVGHVRPAANVPVSVFGGRRVQFYGRCLWGQSGGSEAVHFQGVPTHKSPKRSCGTMPPARSESGPGQRHHPRFTRRPFSSAVSLRVSAVACPHPAGASPGSAVCVSSSLVTREAADPACVHGGTCPGARGHEEPG